MADTASIVAYLPLGLGGWRCGTLRDVTGDVARVEADGGALRTFPVAQVTLLRRQPLLGAAPLAVGARVFLALGDTGPGHLTYLDGRSAKHLEAPEAAGFPSYEANTALSRALRCAVRLIAGTVVGLSPNFAVSAAARYWVLVDAATDPCRLALGGWLTVTVPPAVLEACAVLGRGRLASHSELAAALRAVQGHAVVVALPVTVMVAEGPPQPSVVRTTTPAANEDAPQVVAQPTAALGKAHLAQRHIALLVQSAIGGDQPQTAVSSRDTNRGVAADDDDDDDATALKRRVLDAAVAAAGVSASVTFARGGGGIGFQAAGVRRRTVAEVNARHVTAQAMASRDSPQRR
jgi:hypothetical protein